MALVGPRRGRAPEGETESHQAPTGSTKTGDAVLDADGYMARRIASINEHPIAEADRKFRWPLGPRPADHPGLSDLGL